MTDFSRGGWTERCDESTTTQTLPARNSRTRRTPYRKGYICSILRQMPLIAHAGTVDNTIQATMQTSLFGSADLRCGPSTASFVDLDPQSSVLFEPGWVQGSDTLFESLRVALPWRSVERPMYDRMVDVPRLICTATVANYDQTHPLRQVTTALENLLSVRFSTIGANFYRTGNDSVAWHQDSIDRTSRPSTVALVSLGSPRTLAMRPTAATSTKAPKTAETTRSTPATRYRWRLGHGDLLVMNGACQRNWEHCVPKERAVGPRISLAFRCH